MLLETQTKIKQLPPSFLLRLHRGIYLCYLWAVLHYNLNFTTFISFSDTCMMRPVAGRNIANEIKGSCNSNVWRPFLYSVLIPLEFFWMFPRILTFSAFPSVFNFSFNWMLMWIQMKGCLEINLILKLKMKLTKLAWKKPWNFYFIQSYNPKCAMKYHNKYEISRLIKMYTLERSLICRMSALFPPS